MYAGLFTQSELDGAIADGLVRTNAHPEADLWILNYTEKAAYDAVWNNVTLNCRGLIVDINGEVVARPFPKFFNYGQVGCPEIDIDAPAIVSDKMDGSLGILYLDNFTGKYAIATRGSFTSDQAIHATELLRTKYANFKPIPGWTYLFEIIYPENRIVCDYDGMDDLVLIGMVNIESGGSVTAFTGGWRGPVTEIFQWENMRQALEANPRPGKEGFVVHFLDSDIRVKIKQEDYIALHRIVTNLNARSVWQAMLDDKVQELIEQIPDEFHDFIRGVERDIENDVWESHGIVVRAFKRIKADMAAAGESTKKDFALRAKDHNYSWALFKCWDGYSLVEIYNELLKRAKPNHDYSPVKVSNDAD